jgi:hypothetical protein
MKNFFKKIADFFASHHSWLCQNRRCFFLALLVIVILLLFYFIKVARNYPLKIDL